MRQVHRPCCRSMQIGGTWGNVVTTAIQVTSTLLPIFFLCSPPTSTTIYERPSPSVSKVDPPSTRRSTSGRRSLSIRSMGRCFPDSRSARSLSLRRSSLDRTCTGTYPNRSRSGAAWRAEHHSLHLLGHAACRGQSVLFDGITPKNRRTVSSATGLRTSSVARGWLRNTGPRLYTRAAHSSISERRPLRALHRWYTPIFPCPAVPAADVPPRHGLPAPART